MASDEALSYFENRKVEWKFNFLRAPWWGGFFERMVGCVERTFYKTLRNSKLSSCELYTTLIEIEGTINNRPLTYAYGETDAEMLTPAHLMYGYRFDMIPDDVKDEEDETSIQKRHRYLANKRRHYWNRWRSEYLTSLREHHKMKDNKSARTVQVGDVVIVVDESKLPRGRWRLGHVTKLISGSDGVARGATVDVIVSGGRRLQMDRPVQKLIPLEINAVVAEQKEDQGASVKQRRRAAKTDADWRRKLMDQMLDQLD